MDLALTHCKRGLAFKPRSEMFMNTLSQIVPFPSSKISRCFRSSKIETKNLILEKLTDESIAQFLTQVGNGQKVKTAEWETLNDQQKLVNYLRVFKTTSSLTNGELSTCWGLRENNKSNCFGVITLMQKGPIMANLGFFLGQEWISKKLNVEAVRSVIDWCFSEYSSIERIQGSCSSIHVIGSELLDRAGMLLEGINRAMLKIQDKLMDLNCYSITRQQWASTAPFMKYGTSFPMLLDGHI
jgi:RimJ/RimL family protein N-acetyltransferase